MYFTVYEHVCEKHLSSRVGVHEDHVTGFIKRLLCLVSAQLREQS